MPSKALKNVNRVLKEKRIPCANRGCPERFSRQSNADEHFRTQHTPRKCTICQHVCDNNKAFKTHFLGEHNEEYRKSQEVKSQSCPICTSTTQNFKSIELLISHMEIFHPKERENEVYVVPFSFLKPIIPRFKELENSTVLGGSGPENVGDEDDEDMNWSGMEESENIDFTPSTKARNLARNLAYIAHYRQSFSGFCAEIPFNEVSRDCSGFTERITEMKNPCPFRVAISQETTKFGPCYTLLKVEKIEQRSMHIYTVGCTAKIYHPEGRLCKEHQDRDDIRRATAIRDRFVDTHIGQRKGLGESIRTPANFQHFLEKCGLDTRSTAASTLLFETLVDNKSNLFFIDTEFIDSTIIEVCILDALGKVVLDTPIDFGCTVRELWERFNGKFGLRKLAVTHGHPSEKPTQGMTIEAIHSVLMEAGFNQNSVLVEWSSSKCDYHQLFRAFEHAGLSDAMPPPNLSVQMIPLYRAALPGFLSWKLSVFFSFIYPTRTDLLLNAHRANPDAQMLFLATEIFLTNANQ